MNLEELLRNAAHSMVEVMVLSPLPLPLSVSLSRCISFNLRQPAKRLLNLSHYVASDSCRIKFI